MPKNSWNVSYNKNKVFPYSPMWFIGGRHHIANRNACAHHHRLHNRSNCEEQSNWTSNSLHYKHKTMFGGSSSSSGGGMFGGGGSGGGSSATESILPTFQDEPACAQCCPQLSFKQRCVKRCFLSFYDSCTWSYSQFRIIGYATCQAVGFLLSLMGTLVLFGGTNAKNIRVFAVLYVLGNVVGMLSCL